MLRQPIRCLYDQFAGLFEARKVLRVLAYYNFLDDPLDDRDHRFGQHRRSGGNALGRSQMQVCKAASTGLYHEPRRRL
jgi:hypothetical protein